MGCHQFSKGAVTQLQNNGYCSAICFVQKTGSKIFNDARMSQLSLKKVNQDSETILFNFIIIIIKNLDIWTILCKVFSSMRL